MHFPMLTCVWGVINIFRLKQLISILPRHWLINVIDEYNRELFTGQIYMLDSKYLLSSPVLDSFKKNGSIYIMVIN